MALHDYPERDRHMTMRQPDDRHATMSESSTASHWYAVTVPVPLEQTEIAIAILSERGYPSCEIHEDQQAGTAGIIFYVEAKTEERASEIAAAATRGIELAAGASVTIAVLDETDWSENWKRFFPRLRIGKRLEVVPPWEDQEPSEPGRHLIVLDPGMAFGTGNHATTASCLELIEQLVRPGALVADVGCGSGILSIAAAKLGAARVLATDNDQAAVNAARANLVSNGVADRVEVSLAAGPPAAPGGSGGFDLVLANIYAECLVEMHDPLTSCVKIGGSLVLSGIESSRGRLIEEHFVGASWPVIARIERDVWVTLALERRR